MCTIVLNSRALTAAAASIGIFDEEALTQHLGLKVEHPLTPLMMAAVLAHLPAAASTVFELGGSGHRTGGMHGVARDR